MKVTRMSVRCIPVCGTEAEKLVPILHDAEEDDERIRTALRDPARRSYAAFVDEESVGAAVVRWQDGAGGEILFLAVAALAAARLPFTNRLVATPWSASPRPSSPICGPSGRLRRLPHSSESPTWVPCRREGVGPLRTRT
jgi:hypothetical protein